ncbi:MAG: hypothetical protein J6C46_04265, partial [Clostridia bacterium]|nr:hypothetical protein [Clostridia bacterium]
MRLKTHPLANKPEVVLPKYWLPSTTVKSNLTADWKAFFSEEREKAAEKEPFNILLKIVEAAECANAQKLTFRQSSESNGRGVAFKSMILEAIFFPEKEVTQGLYRFQKGLEKI